MTKVAAKILAELQKPNPCLSDVAQPHSKLAFASCTEDADCAVLYKMEMQTWSLAVQDQEDIHAQINDTMHSSSRC